VKVEHPPELTAFTLGVKPRGTRPAPPVDHAGLVVYTDTNYLRDDPQGAVRTLERVFSYYPPEELANEHVWLDQWRQ
jgi:hypothetical protein